MKLSNYAQGRDNNFNLIRIIAALAVLGSHSFALSTGSGDAEPLRKLLGMSMGTIAVDVFFVTSGFLVTSSLLSRKSTIEFIWARVLRIFPALALMLLLTVFVLGVFFTTLPASAYLSLPETYFYLVKNTTLITGVAYFLPGVFDDNPYKSAVNGSLWTMPYEIRLYAILAIIWSILRIAKKTRSNAFQTSIIVFSVLSGIYLFAEHFIFNSESRSARLAFMFFSGSVFYILREQVFISHRAFWLSVVLIAVATFNNQLFAAVYFLTITYILFYLAYIPSGFIRAYNRLGDYSYGVYIYAFPVQQTVAALVPGVSVRQMLLLSATATIVLAILSWHLLERRCLGLKTHYVEHTKNLLATLTLRIKSALHR
jgi:peptidoglycan/LPS O-acetylase OafA/YrhL